MAEEEEEEYTMMRKLDEDEARHEVIYEAIYEENNGEQKSDSYQLIFGL